MIRAFLTALAVLTGLTLLAVVAAAAPPSFNGERRPYTILIPPVPAPITPMHTQAGGVTNLGQYRGRVVLLNIWASWCPVCLRELPALERLQQALGGADFSVVTLSLDSGGPQQAAAYLRRLGIRHLPALGDPAGRAATAFELGEGLPWSFIIDRQGYSRGYIMGAADWDSDAARALVRYYLSEKAVIPEAQ